MVKIGFGYDIHKFSPKRKLFLGGIQIPFPQGLLGHSDADVVVHAVCDALLGALGSGDIGELFPNTDAKYKNISSLKLLAEVRGLLKKMSFSIGNIDIMLLCEAPKISPYKEKMKKALARALKIDSHQISVKATTQEGIGAIGKGKAAAAYAVALVQSLKK